MGSSNWKAEDGELATYRRNEPASCTNEPVSLRLVHFESGSFATNVTAIEQLPNQECIPLVRWWTGIVDPVGKRKAALQVLFKTMLHLLMTGQVRVKNVSSWQWRITMRRDEILRLLSEHRAELEQLGAKSLALFGSAARDEARQDSDVDLLVEFERPVGLFEFVDLKSYLENLLGCQVDLGTPASLKPRLRERVLKEAVYVH